MNLLLKIGVLAVIVAAVAAAVHKCCPQPENEGMCGCCPDACCCMCDNVTVTLPPMATPVDMTTPPLTTSQRCYPSALDVVFIVDSSSSVGSVSWGLTMQFLADLVAEDAWIPMGGTPVGGDDGTRFGFIKYASQAEVVWSILDEESDSVAALDAAFLAQLWEGEFTNTIEAMQFATIMLEDEDRDDAVWADLVILLSDGLTNEPQFFWDLLEPVSAAMRAAADLTFAIGIGPFLGGIGVEELQLITGKPGSNESLYMAEDFDTLADELSMIIDSILINICETITPEPRTQPPTNAPTTPTTTVVSHCECCCPPLPDKCGGDKVFGDRPCGCCSNY